MFETAMAFIPDNWSWKKNLLLDKLFLIAAYCKSLFLSFYEEKWINEVFIQRMRYQSSMEKKVSASLLESEFQKTKKKVVKFLKASYFLILSATKVIM